MAFPTTAILDAFTRANEGPPPSASWTADQMNVAVAGHSVVSNAASNGAHTYWSAASFAADLEAYFTIGAITTVVGLHARIQNPVTAGADAYECTWNVSGTLEVVRVIDAYSVETSLGTASVAAAATGHQFGVEVLGAGATVTVNLYINTGSGWTLGLTVGDTGGTRITAGGFVGMLTGHSSDIIDSFGGGAVIVPGTGWGPLIGTRRNRLVA